MLGMNGMMPWDLSQHLPWQVFMLWDRLHGTLRRRGRRYGEGVFGGKGEAGKGEAGKGEASDDFVQY